MSSFNASPAIPVIAAVFYVASYLSFVYLLRYPRNWHPPSLLGSLTTVVLVAGTVSLVAFSPTGFDGRALIVVIGLFVFMFIIIGAPAIAFRPASGPIEFFAKHGDYAGLWLAAPAFVAGMTIPNPNLQAVLTTAIAIELSWLVRQRWAARNRQLHLLSDHDILVLERQAEGNIEGFQARHGINELTLMADEVRWKGCSKRTPPCPFNLYVNRLGLNTAPCCREHLCDLSHYIAATLREMEVVHWLEGGSLLGAVREAGNMLDWEDDVDISVLLDDDMTWQRLVDGLAKRCAQEGYYVDLFESKGFISISFDAPKIWPFRWERNRLRGEIRADIAVYREAISNDKEILERLSYKGSMPATESGGFGVPREIVLPTTSLPYLGGNFACPNEPKAYLRLLYGDFENVEYTYVDPTAAAIRAAADAANKS